MFLSGTTRTCCAACNPVALRVKDRFQARFGQSRGLPLSVRTAVPFAAPSPYISLFGKPFLVPRGMNVLIPSATVQHLDQAANSAGSGRSLTISGIGSPRTIRAGRPSVGLKIDETALSVASRNRLPVTLLSARA
jgi:hypothetical protein